MYLKKETLVEQIPHDYKQTFHHDFTNTVSSDVIVKLRHTEKITDRDLNIVEFLYNFKFATPEQIYTFLKEEELSLGALTARLDKLVHNRILNKFLLSPIKEDRIYPDALTLYCVDLGGKYLLTSFSSIDTVDWFSSENFKTSELVSKYLMVVDVYLQLMNQTDGKLEFFESNYLFQANGVNLYPSFYFAVKSGGERHYFIGDIVKEDDLPLLFRKKAEKLNYLLSTNAWKKYFFDKNTAPILLLMTPNDLMAKETGQLMHNCTEIEKVFLTTPQRFAKGLSQQGGLLKYSVNEDMLKEGKSTLFTPENLD